MFNAVTKVSFSDEPVGSSASSTSVYSSDAIIGGGYTVQNTSFEGATILLVFRDGVQWALITGSYSAGLKQCKLVSDTIQFNTLLAPIQVGENVTVLYVSSSGEIVLTEPITLSEAKLFLRTSGTTDDDLITELISSARQACERYACMSFVPRTITADINNSLGGIALPYGPIIAVTSVKDDQDLDVNYKYLRGYLIEPFLESLQVVYAAGYSLLPKEFKTAILRQVAYLWRNRGDMNVSNELSGSAMEILYKYRAI